MKGKGTSSYEAAFLDAGEIVRESDVATETLPVGELGVVSEVVGEVVDDVAFSGVGVGVVVGVVVALALIASAVLITMLPWRSWV